MTVLTDKIEGIREPNKSLIILLDQFYTEMKYYETATDADTKEMQELKCIIASNDIINIIVDGD